MIKTQADRIKNYLHITFGVLVFFSALFVSNISVSYASEINVKVLGIFANSIVVGGTATDISDGTPVSIQIINQNEEVVGSASILVTLGNIGPQSISATLVGGQNYLMQAQALDMFEEVIASSSDVFRSVGVTGVQFFNATPTSIQINLTSFGGDSEPFQPGLSARLYYKPLPISLLGELLYEFLPDATYIDFPLNQDGAPGTVTQQVLLGLMPNTTYAYKVALSPIDEDDNGRNDNYQLFVFPIPQESDFIYSPVPGPLLFGGLGNTLPTFSTPNVVGGAWQYTGGSDGGTGGSQTQTPSGGGGYTGGGGYVGQPFIFMTNVEVLPTSAILQGTVENIPENYTVTLFVFNADGDVVNGGGTPLLTGPGSFNAPIFGLTPSTYHTYKFIAEPDDINYVGNPLFFQNLSWHFTTPPEGVTAPVVVTPTQTPTVATYTNDFAGGLVPCSGTAANPCTFNKFMALANKVIQFLIFGLALPISAIAFAYAGFLLLTSGGNEANRTKAKDVFKTVFLGLLAALAAWLIVYTILKSLSVNLSPSSGWSWLSQVGGN